MNNEKEKLNALHGRIEDAIQTLGVDMSVRAIPVGELEKITGAARCEMFDVMWYIRYERRHYLNGHRYR